MTVLDQFEMGVGAWAWGDQQVWQYGKSYGPEEVRGAFFTSLECGVRLVDTAEIYGNGTSESLIGEFLKNLPGPRPFIATKFWPRLFRLKQRSLLAAAKNSLKRLGIQQIDLYQIHQPFSLRSPQTWAKALTLAVQEGLVKTVGVSNYNRDQMLRARDTLAKAGIPLSSNQVNFSLIRRKLEKNGLLASCQKEGIKVIAYSPLGKGLLSGKYGPQNPPPGLRKLLYYPSLLAKLPVLLGLMREIGQAHGNKTTNQVAINWCICKGTLPIPGAKNAAQAKENAGSQGWRLSSREIEALDKATENFQSFYRFSF